MSPLWSRWLSRLKQQHAKGAARKRPGVVPRLEALEERYVPSTITVNEMPTLDTHAVTPASSPLDSNGKISLRSAIEFENATTAGGDTISLPGNTNPYLLTLGQLSLTKSMTILGAGPTATAIDAAGASRILSIDAGGISVTLQGLTLENGRANPTDVVPGAFGGAIFDSTANSATSLNIVDSTLTNNRAIGADNSGGAGGVGEGGAVYQYGGTLSFTDSTVSNNHAYGGAGASGYGGGVGEGGGVYTLLGQLNVQSSTFNNNQAVGGSPGDFSHTAGAAYGGAIYDVSRVLTTAVQHETVAATTGPMFSVTDSTFNGNSVTGGANTISGPSGPGGASGLGGAIYDATTAVVTDDTIAGNTANGGAGNNPGGTGVGRGGGFYFSGGEGITAHVGGSIIATNTASTNVVLAKDIGPQLSLGTNGPDVYARTTASPFTSDGHNLIGDNDEGGDGFPASPTNGDQVGGTVGNQPNNAIINPLLGPLGPNGGPTETMAITAGSPAYGNGGSDDGITADQRGVPRPINGRDDVGAYEVDTVPPTAVLNAANDVTASEDSNNTTTVVITYSSTGSPVDPSTFGTGNITVGNGATVTRFSVNGDTVTYTVQSPGPNYGQSPNGPQNPYIISLTGGNAAGGVKNMDGTEILAVQDFGSFIVDTPPPPPPAAAGFFAVAAGGDSSRINIYNSSTGALEESFLAFNPGIFGVSIAVADVNGDHTPDVIVGAGAGHQTNVEIIDGTKLNQIDPHTGQIQWSALIGGSDFYAFDPRVLTGVNVAAADVNHDGHIDVILGAGPGGGPDVEVIDGTKLLNGQGKINMDPTSHEIEWGALIGQHDFFAYASTFTGGVTVAGGDVNGDGFGDVIVGAGPGGKAEVKVFDGNALTNNPANANVVALSDFFAYDRGFSGGVTVAFGVTESGTRELVAALESGNQSNVEVIDASKIVGFTGQAVVPFTDFIGPASAQHDFFAFDPASFHGGVSIAMQDVNGDGFPDLIAGPGPGGPPQPVEVIDGAKLAAGIGIDPATGSYQVTAADLLFAAFFPFGPQYIDGVSTGAVVR